MWDRITAPLPARGGMSTEPLASASSPSVGDRVPAGESRPRALCIGSPLLAGKGLRADDGG